MENGISARHILRSVKPYATNNWSEGRGVNESIRKILKIVIDFFSRHLFKWSIFFLYRSFNIRFLKICLDERVKTALPRVETKTTTKIKGTKEEIEKAKAINDNTIQVGGLKIGRIFRRKTITNTSIRMAKSIPC